MITGLFENPNLYVSLSLLLSTSLLCSTAAPDSSSYLENDVIAPQHKLINEMNQNFSELEKASEKLIDLGSYVGPHKVPPKTVKITNTVAVKVPVPYPVKVPHPVPVPVPVDRVVPLPVPKLVRIPEPTAAIPTVTSPVNYVTSPHPHEQDVAHSNTNAQVQEFMHSYPIHSVFDVGMNYNPVIGNRLALNKPTGAASEHRPRHLGPELDKLNEYSAASTRYSSKQNYEGGFRSTASPDESGYHKYYSTAQPESAPSANYEYKFSSPHPEVIPHSYREPKSVYYTKDDKYPTPKFPRPTHSAYPTSPTFQTKDPSYGQENDFRQYSFKTAPTPPSFRHTSIKESYPHYEQPDFKQYHYQKPSVESESYVEHQPKHSKYIEHYEKPSGSDNGYVEHREVGESSAVYKQYEQQIESSFEDQRDQYGKPSANPEIYSHYEAKEPQQQEYKSYYARPIPVSEALAYLDKQPSHGSEQKVYFHKPMNYQVRAHKPPHKSQHSSESTDLTYNFPSDSHLHPTYSEIEHKHHPYYSSTAEHPSFDEESSGAPKYYHHPSPSPSPSPSSNHHVIAYNHPSGPEQYQRRQYYFRHETSDEAGSAEASSDMMQSGSKSHAAYERAVELKHRAANPKEYSMYSVEHLHHHHGDVDDSNDYDGRDYQ
ncbi:conserved hypothetical protein [Culex quinquefasciatus]|uniref:Uncharacterized protein n=1 Tax=Culex quinquefasciatus TaxID=7176 RepID=B0X005_CULQU|nr:conserved hypothetical protein [Culex quinquefasciatus]|eukprot:XP_001862977.1 conserved hypothetical protein [Culex quinquefasciatus]